MEKGLEVGIDRLIYVISAIVFILVIISIARGLLSDTEIKRTEITISGDKNRVLNKLPGLIEYCWENNKGTFEAKICQKVKIDIDGNITEREITGGLNCNKLPNNNCLRGNCSFCESFKYEEDDKIDWRDEIGEGESTILIKYVPKKIIVERKSRVIG